MNNNVEVKIKVQTKLVLILSAIIIPICTHNSWWVKKLSTEMFWVAWFVMMTLGIYLFRLFIRTFSSPYFRALKKIVIDGNDNVDFIFTPPYKKVEAAEIKQNITIVVKGKVMKFYKHDRRIGNVHKNTLVDKNDWDVLQSLFSPKLKIYNSQILKT